ncbi:MULTISPECIES: hypothetical protein [unclassified Geodermatophilus]
MSSRRPTRTRVLTGAAAVATVLLAGLTGSAALADPPALDDRTPSCSELLGQVDDWPGTGPDGQQLYSDAFEQHLLSQPACATPSA